MKKINSFNVIEKRKDQYILQEEENKIFLFFKKNRNFITFSLFLFVICILLVIVGVSVSLFRGSNDYDITYIVGDEEVDVNNDPDIGDEEVEDELLGEIAREDGVVLLVETVMSSNGDVISYYSDKSAIVVRANGKIYRVSSDKKGEYGIDKNGKIDDSAIKILVTSTTTTLSDGSVITNYSDGTAKVEVKGNALFVRDSNNIELFDGNKFNKTLPSGVSLSLNSSRINGQYVSMFTDDATYISSGEDKYIINKNTKPNLEDGSGHFDRSNSFEAIAEKKYGDYVITHYLNGSATLMDNKGNVFFVRKSGDLVLKDKKFYEILPNKGKSNSRGNMNCSNRVVVTYFDNGAAVVIFPDGNRQYVEDADEIIYDHNRNITGSYNYSPMTEVRITEEGEVAYNFENGKSQVMNKKNKGSYIVDTDTLKFKPIPKPEDPEEKPDDENDEDKPIVDPAEGIVISKAENIYNEFKDVERTEFTIRNNNPKNKTLRIVIEEVSDYKKYNTNRLDPKYVKFQATVGGEPVQTTVDGVTVRDIVLDNKTFVDSDGVTNYVIFDGTIKAKSSVIVVLSLYVDYELLDNIHQNKGFVGTIKIYVEDK